MSNPDSSRPGLGNTLGEAAAAPLQHHGRMAGKTVESLPFVRRYAHLPEALWTRERVTPLEAPWLVAWSDDAARALGLDGLDRADLVAFFNGQREAPGVEPIATAYAGHQFGVFVPRLGDGRAVLLCEMRAPSGETWEVQVKGSGRTAFARGFDGRAVLRSAVRELLASEALDGLGVPTTRALCVIGSRTPVQREALETGASLVRLAPTHVRFGTFEYAARAPSSATSTALADFVVREGYPELDAAAPDRHVRLLEQVVVRTARLVARWQAVGFTHGVLNTDNMSITGLTLDYGPFAFVETYDPGLVVNHSDPTGRYAFDRQPAVGMWNLAQLARALAPLVPLEQAQAALERYEAEWAETYLDLMRQKLGLEGQAGTEDLLEDLQRAMFEGGADYTATLRALGAIDPATPGSDAQARAAFRDPRAWEAFAPGYLQRLRVEGVDPAARRARQDRVNPRFVLRTHLAQRAIERAEQGDGGEVARLLAILRRPFDEQPEHDAYAAPPPPDAPPVVLSCSS